MKRSESMRTKGINKNINNKGAGLKDNNRKLKKNYLNCGHAEKRKITINRQQDDK